MIIEPAKRATAARAVRSVENRLMHHCSETTSAFFSRKGGSQIELDERLTDLRLSPASRARQSLATSFLGLAPRALAVARFAGYD